MYGLNNLMDLLMYWMMEYGIPNINLKMNNLAWYMNLYYKFRDYPIT